MNGEYEQKRIEEEVRRFWEENDIKKKVRETTAGNEKFFMIDGPPYLTGPPHVGHMQGKVIKDVMLRFKQMQGYDVWDQAGFDTHGLPNELATEEELGIDNKNEIGERISAAEFIKRCRERATSAEGLWKTVMTDLGIWQDFDDPYMTYDNDYIESEWWLVKKVAENGLLYTARKPIHWCPRCQTSLSGYEVSDEYREIEDRSIYVKLPLKNKRGNLVIWTTTPWTVPANMAVYVHPDFDYVKVDVNGEVLVIADQLLDEVMERAGYEKDYEILETVKGTDLEGKKYEHPFLEEIPKQKEMDGEDGVHRIHTSREFVTLEEGTGLVHAATGHGQEDYEASRDVDLPVYSPVDREGKYTEDAGKYGGERVLDVDEKIVGDLKDKGFILKDETIRHEYPHCWRCKTQLLIRAAEQWFIENERVKERMLEENEKVDWIPETARNRFGKFVEKSPDWCISRQNYWGVPLPIWICDGCGDRNVVGSFDELEEKHGELPQDFNPHKHVVDKLTWDCDCGGEYERVEDILDVWFDSGSAPFASLHYPFEEEPFESLWPMDFITEGSDQIRGWFYSLLFCSILAFDERPYEKILFQGHVLDDEGKKMSKSEGNVVDPVGQLEKYGADLTRFYSLRVAAPWEQTKYDEEEIENEIYRLFSVYWNVKEFLNTYGDPEAPEPDEEDMEPEDRWILSRVNSIAGKMERKMEDSRFHEFTRSLEAFVLEDLSRWYVKKVRKRMKGGDEAAMWSLRKALEKTNVMLAPFAPHITEKVYRDMDGQRKSVHMEGLPEAEGERIDGDLEKDMERVREIVEKTSRIRDENQYILRWPARKAVISTDGETKKRLEKMKGIIKEMANVKEVEFGEVAMKLAAKPDYSAVGPRFGDSADEVARLIEELEHEEIEKIQDLGKIEVEGYEVEEGHIDVRSKAGGGMESKEFEKGEVYLDVHMTEDIEEEAYVREVIREVQQERKETGLDVEDEVELSFKGDVGPLKKLKSLIEERVNVGTISFGEADFKHKGDVEFRGRRVEFSFSDPV